MNEKIKQLAEQAGLKTELWYDPEPFMIYKEDANNPGGLEKFAELIVKECIEVIEKQKAKMSYGPTFVIEDIKQHFGVEE